jgi:hypothetical protein
MSVDQTNAAIELGFQITFYVLLGLFALTGALLSGVFFIRSERFWRWYRIPIAITAAMISGISLGIIGYFVVVLFILDTAGSPVDYIPGYENSGLVGYGFLAVFGAAYSIYPWAALLCGRAKSTPS